MNNFKKICACATITLLCAASCARNDDQSFENVDLIPVKLSKDAKWSMVNDKGEVVYDGEFTETPSLAVNGVFSVKEKEGYSVYKADGKKPELLANLEKLYAVGMMEDGLMPVVFPKSRISVVDASGKKKFEMIPVKNQEVVMCGLSYSDGMLGFKLDNGKLGFYDQAGKVAVDPVYDNIGIFKEGLAVVGKLKNDSTEEYDYSVIDKSGKTVFKLKDSYQPYSINFNGGYFLVKKDDRLILIDKNGEEIKMPAKIKDISYYNSNYVIFENDEDEMGIANTKGEIIVRAKYQRIWFDEADSFFAIKEDGDKEVIRLNAEGEESEKKLDYEDIYNVGKFGFLAKEGSTWLLLDSEMKAKSQDEFYDFNLSPICLTVESDYFNVDVIAKSMVSMIKPNGIGDYKIGEKASEALKGKDPKDFTYQTYVSLNDLKVEGFRYKIEPALVFDNNIADYDFASGSVNHYWNPESKVTAYRLDLTCEKEWGESGQKAMTDVLKSKGYKLLKQGVDSTNSSILAAVLAKGDFIIAVLSRDEGNGCSVICFNDPKIKEEALNGVVEKSKDGKGDSAAESESEAVADTAVVAEEVP